MFHILDNAAVISMPSGVILAPIAITVLSFCFAYALREGTVGNIVISYFLNNYLRWRYPINSTDGSIALPSAVYKFPNGQGNIAKFLDGEEESRRWQEQLGPIYRIWAGFQSEVVLTRPDQVQAVFKDSHQHLKGKSINSS
ncbi:unnamed protein product [Periconia digitata]|uniref:Uncharacterized protein n=1 Tax=Periconia digitata TaxID=1303443 RepID=A0A9W4UAF7_9PLEO|nr:unnamed protein product [Periconia digitata]